MALRGKYRNNMLFAILEMLGRRYDFTLDDPVGTISEEDTVILAPCDGTTGRKEIQEGQLIQPGQTLVDIVDENERWIVANYKETQTTHIREGQPVEIEVDAVPGITFKGAVKSISRATGASFSLLPQDNSAGNFVKVEQRIPVRIEFSTGNRLEDMERLRAGMNVECVVNY